MLIKTTDTTVENNGSEYEKEFIISGYNDSIL